MKTATNPDLIVVPNASKKYILNVTIIFMDSEYLNYKSVKGPLISTDICSLVNHDNSRNK